MGVNFYLQMQWVEQNFGPSKFIMTSNDNLNSHDSAGSSHHVDRLAKNGHLSGCSLLHENIEYLHTKQNVWLLDKKHWYNDFDNFYKDVFNFDPNILSYIKSKHDSINND
jgi:hypothetical protein